MAVMEMKRAAPVRPTPAGAELSHEEILDQLMASDDQVLTLKEIGNRNGRDLNEIGAELLGYDREQTADLMPELAEAVCADRRLTGIAVRSAVKNENIDDAVALLKDHLALAERPNRKIVVEALQREISSWAEQDALTPQEARFEAIFLRSVLPSDAIWNTFRHFNQTEHPLLLEILGGHGETYGSQILDELMVVFHEDPEALAKDAKIVRGFLRTGYRGFSARTFCAYRDAWNRSELEARYLIQKWSAISRTLVTGREVSPELKNDELYPEFICAAYRPARFIGPEDGAPPLGIEYVRQLIEMGNGFQEHLKRFIYPRSGYPAELAGHAGVSRAAAADLSRFQSCLECVQDAASIQVTPKALTLQIARLLQGAVQSVDRRIMLACVLQNAAKESDVSILAKECMTGNPPDSELQRLPVLRLLLGDLFEDHFLEHIPQYVGGLHLSGKLAGRVRARLGLEPEEPIDLDKLVMLASLEVPKIFALDLTYLRSLERTGGTDSRGGSYRTYLSKASHCFVARSSAALCTTSDTWSWQNPDYLQSIMVDMENARIVGVTQLHLFSNAKGAPSVMARPNPTEAFVDKVDKAALARAMLAPVLTFAQDNNLKPYLPEQGEYRMLTNRNGYLPYLEPWFGECEESDIQVTGHTFQNIKAIYGLLPEPRERQK